MIKSSQAFDWISFERKCFLPSNVPLFSHRSFSHHFIFRSIYFLGFISVCNGIVTRKFPEKFQLWRNIGKNGNGANFSSSSWNPQFLSFKIGLTETTFKATQSFLVHGGLSPAKS